MNEHIPNIIHVTWVKKEILNDPYPLIQNGLKNLVDLNPNWKLTIYSDEEIDLYLKNNLDKKEYDLFANSAIVTKIDLWRLIKMYNEGGLYTDLDRYHNIPLNQILEQKTKCMLPTWKDHDFSHTFMMSAPKNPIYESAFNLLMQRKKAGSNSIYYLGPQTYMHAVTQTLVGKMIDTNPGAKIFNEIRKIISETEFLKTYRESSYGDCITNKSNITEDEFESHKREYYAACGVKHWTGNW
jgi:mannosyltransferase OCH1-like enzyme